MSTCSFHQAIHKGTPQRRTPIEAFTVENMKKTQIKRIKWVRSVFILLYSNLLFEATISTEVASFVPGKITLERPYKTLVNWTTNPRSLGLVNYKLKSLRFASYTLMRPTLVFSFLYQKQNISSNPLMWNFTDSLAAMGTKWRWWRHLDEEKVEKVANT